MHQKEIQKIVPRIWKVKYSFPTIWHLDCSGKTLESEIVEQKDDNVQSENQSALKVASYRSHRKPCGTCCAGHHVASTNAKRMLLCACLSLFW